MDGSLSGLKPYQLELAEEEARLLCKNMIDQIIQYHGELCVLWHNGMFEKRKENYQKNIYDWILDYCAKWIKKSEERNQHWD